MLDSSTLKFKILISIQMSLPTIENNKKSGILTKNMSKNSKIKKRVSLADINIERIVQI